jgi:hypothetical protein
MERMLPLATIRFDDSEYDERLRSVLEASGVDPQEFEGLEWFGLLPFFVLAGASVRSEVHGHGDHVHFESATVELPDELADAFFGSLPVMLEQAYGDHPAHEHGDEPHAHGEEPHAHGEEPHGDEPHAHGEEPHAR